MNAAEYGKIIADAVLAGPGHTVTVPADGTWLVIDGAPRRVSIEDHHDAFEHNGAMLRETWDLIAEDQ